MKHDQQRLRDFFTQEFPRMADVTIDVLERLSREIPEIGEREPLIRNLLIACKDVLQGEMPRLMLDREMLNGTPPEDVDLHSAIGKFWKPKDGSLNEQQRVNIAVWLCTANCAAGEAAEQETEFDWLLKFKFLDRALTTASACFAGYRPVVYEYFQDLDNVIFADQEKYLQ